jgi:hypothetical protein
LLDFYIKKFFKKLFLWPKSYFENNFLKKLSFFVRTTTGASNYFGIEKFFEALIPLTSPVLMKGASRENILSN